MSLPFAITTRLECGDSIFQIVNHIFVRTISLLIIGVFMVNSESMSDQGIFSPALWGLFMYTGVILTWKQPTQDQNSFFSLNKILKFSGIIILLIMAILYRGQGEPGLIEMRPHWWGIIGLIGWAYLISGLVLLIFRKNITAMMGIVGLLYCVYFAENAGFFAPVYDIFPWINIGSMLGSHAAITLSGVILGMILLPGSLVQTTAHRLRWAVLFGLGLFVAGYLLHTLQDIHQMFIVNKILATPSWCLITSAFTVWLWVIIYYIIDIRAWNKWIGIVKPAGANALFAYILAPVLYYIFAISAYLFDGFNFYNWLGESFVIGFWRSVLFAFAVTWLAGGLRRLGLVLKL